MRFLTDAQTSAVFVKMLRDLGWDVDTVYDHGIHREPDDARLIDWARVNGGRVFITFDLLGKEQGAKVSRQLREHGGKVISIGGGPDQACERALGRLLFHMPDWEPFLTKHDGRVDIRDLKPCKLRLASKMKVAVRPLPYEHFDTYLDNRAEAKRKPRKRRTRTKVSQQGHLDIERQA